MNKRARIKGNNNRKDISLMTLLANEATSDSRKLLKKYGQSDAIDHADLEVKLANLYFQTDDKKKLEQELAQIHPHKNWLLRSIPPTQVIKEEVIVKAEPEKKNEPKANADGDSCNPNCPYCRMRMSNCCGNNYSGFNGEQQSTSIKPSDYIGLIGIVAVVGSLFFVLSKTVK